MIKELKGSNGKIVGSNEYINSINHSVLKGLMPNNKGRNRYYDLYKDIENNPHSKKYTYIISKYQTKDNKINFKKIFEPVSNIIIKDISHASKDTYIKDENGEQLKVALYQLKLCNIPYLDNIVKELNKLCWYIDVNEKNVKKLQRLLNKLGYGPLEVSGIYDIKTDKEWTKFICEIEAGKFTKLSNQTVSGINVIVEYTDTLKIIEDNSHVLANSGIRKLVDNINNASKLVKVGRRVVIISSLALDALELGLSIEKDLTDADKKIGKKTWATGFEIAGSWIGLLAGIKLGSKVGASVAGPTGVIAGAIVGFAATLILSEYGEKLGEYIIDLTDLK